jgi:hypothetical protein
LQFTQANAQTKNCKRAFTFATQKEFQNIFSNASKKNKTPDTQARQKSTRQMTVTDNIKMVVTHDRQERQPIIAPTRNWRFSASYDSFEVNQTLVLRMKFSGENRQLLVAANRQVVKKF